MKVGSFSELHASRNTQHTGTSQATSYLIVCFVLQEFLLRDVSSKTNSTPKQREFAEDLHKTLEGRCEVSLGQLHGNRKGLKGRRTSQNMTGSQLATFQLIIYGAREN